ncbi:lipoprotein [Salmonella sp. NCTC 11881]|nr:lipoprotein [Salmonella sp. NCTC 11881]
MKRTKSIHHASFRKKLERAAFNAGRPGGYGCFLCWLAVKKAMKPYRCIKTLMTVQRRIRAKSAECTTAYNNALKEAERTAPKYATREDCVAEFGEGQCQQAPAQAGMAPENQAQAQQSSGSFWMPLMAGYMMGASDGRRRRLCATAAV